MRSFAVVLLISSVSLTGTLLNAQTAPRTFQSVRTGVPQVDAMRGVLAVTVVWPGADAATPNALRSAPASLRVLARRAESGALRRERRPELSDDVLLIVSLDSGGRELDWRLMPNPRRLRAEVPGPNNQLSGRVIDTNSSELSVRVPDLPNLSKIEVYQPRWTGSDYLLDRVGIIEVPAR